jgi:hypothetical protein
MPDLAGSSPPLFARHFRDQNAVARTSVTETPLAAAPMRAAGTCGCVWVCDSGVTQKARDRSRPRRASFFARQQRDYIHVCIYIHDCRRIDRRFSGVTEVAVDRWGCSRWRRSRQAPTAWPPPSRSPPHPHPETLNPQPHTLTPQP